MQLSSKDVHDTVSSKQDVKTKEEWRVGLKESGTYFSGGPVYRFLTSVGLPTCVNL